MSRFFPNWPEADKIIREFAAQLKLTIIYNPDYLDIRLLDDSVKDKIPLEYYNEFRRRYKIFL